MKKLIAWTVLVSMTVLAFAPLSAFADEPQELERAIRIAKESFSISDEYDQFNYDVRENAGRKIWSMAWSSDDRSDGTIRVSVDSEDMITSYREYKPSKYEGSKLPAISREQARERAEAFMEGLEKGLVDQLGQKDYRNESLGVETFSFSYYRIIAGIPFYGNMVNVEVDKDTGAIKSYYRDWNGKIDFPSTEGIIGMDDAQEAYRDKIGLELIYKYKTQDDELIPYLVYVPKERGSVWIDALTGEKISAPAYYYAGGVEKVADEAKMENELTPEELNAIDEISQLINAEEAEEILRGWNEIGFDDGYEMVSSRLEKAWPDRNRFRWSMSFKKTVEDDGETRTEYGYGSVDAESGEILSFGNSFDGSDLSDEIAYGEEEALEAVEDFLRRFAPERMDDYVYENDLEAVAFEKEENRRKSFNFTRRVEGIPFRSNSITVGFDAAEGRVLSYRLTHFHVGFPSAKGVASIESAYGALNEKIGLELLYVPVEEEYSSRMSIRENETGEVRLVYGLKPMKPAILEAEKLVLLNQNGSLYKEPEVSAYEDLKDHYSQEAVETLAENGIYLEGDYYRPDESITQKDFFILFIHTMGYYVPDERDDEFIEGMYAYLLRQEIIAKEEINQEAIVKRIDAVKYIIRGLGYEKVALLDEIFSKGFADVDESYPELRGYVAIANGLGIVEGHAGSFYPESRLKRGDAAIMIYNRLSQ
jgi:Zn-dependent metalloprotease